MRLYYYLSVYFWHKMSFTSDTMMDGSSPRGRRPKGKERGKTSAWSARRSDGGGSWKGTPARILLFSLFRPLINYAKPTQLWNVWLSKLSNKNHATSFVTKSVGANALSYFLFLLFCARKQILKFEDHRRVWKSDKKPVQKESNCNDVC